MKFIVRFLYFDFFFIVLFVKFLVAGTSDTTLAHLGIVMDVGVRETAATHKENLHAQQHDSQSHNYQCQ